MTTPPDTAADDAPSAGGVETTGPVSDRTLRASSHVLPRMPTAPDTRDRATSDGALVTFHFTGADSAAAPRAGAPLSFPGLADLSARDAADVRALVRQHVETLRHARAPHADALHREVRHLVRRLEDVLALDAQRGGAADRTGATLGGAASSLVDAAAVADAARPRRGPEPLEPLRRARIERARQQLAPHLAPTERAGVTVVHGGRLAGELGDDVTVTCAPDAARTALALAREQLDRHVELLRAVRVARLEADGEYDPEIHDAALAGFGNDALTRAEFLALPSVVLVEAAETLAAFALADLSALLRATGALQILAPDATTASAPRADAAPTADLGQLALVHRDCFVLSSSLAAPEHLAAGLERMASSSRPALAIVTAAPEGASAPPLRAAHAARALPAFTYDPDRGATWPDRFDVSGNPDVRDTWPIVSLRYLDAGDTEQRDSWRLTLAEVFAAHPSRRDSFVVIGPERWSENQLPLDEFVDAWEHGAVQGKVPYFWVVTAEGELARAVVTRELCGLARDRARAWRWLQELGGVHNEWARKAAAEARAETEAEAARERAALEARHADDLDHVRGVAAADAMRRLASVLLELDLSSPAAAPPSAETAPPKAAEAPEPAGLAAPTSPERDPRPRDAPAEPAPRAPTALSAEPSVDTPLCTTCNECTNLNARLFVYDDNKQAVIGDTEAGTFAELVAAAEKCPARCIHPGTPRPDDDTATPEMIARAEPFN